MPKGVYKRTEETRRRMSIAHLGKKIIQPKMTEEHKRKIKEAIHGWFLAQNPLWKCKGNSSAPRDKELRKTNEYKLWRTSVFERDKYTCCCCGAKNGGGKTIVLQAHHIKPFAFFPELRHEVDNGQTLCVSCHRKTEGWGRPKRHLLKG